MRTEENRERSAENTAKLGKLTWLVSARFGAEGDGKAVPAIDGNDGEGKIDQFPFAEMVARFGIQGVGDFPAGDLGQHFGPGQGGTFAFAVERGFAPGVEQIDHTANSYIYDPQGRLRLLVNYGETAEHIAADIRLLLAGK